MRLRRDWVLCCPRNRMMGTIILLHLGVALLCHQNSKLEFLALKWSVTEHFKEYLVYALFVVRTDNNLLTYVLTTPNFDATGHRGVSVLASFELTLGYQKGADNGVADALSQVPIHHDQGTVQSLLEGTIDRGKTEASKELLCEHMCFENETCVQAANLVPMHIVDWGEAQEADVVLATCRKWLCTCKDSNPKKGHIVEKVLRCQCRHRGGLCPLQHAQQFGSEQGITVCQYDAQGRG